MSNIWYEAFPATGSDDHRLRGYRVVVEAAVFRRNADGSKEFVAFFHSPLLAVKYAEQMSQEARNFAPQMPHNPQPATEANYPKPLTSK